MAILKIARMGHPVLFQQAQPVKDPSAPEIRRLVADMIETMEDATGAGLAAPQVHVPLRIFVFRVRRERSLGDPQDSVIDTTVLINPALQFPDDDIRPSWEGCLSIPGLRAAVPRHWRVRYSGRDCDGNIQAREATGFHAAVVQHEYDHLEGILYPMRITDFTEFGFTEEYQRAAAAQANKP
jgi:peptide deformylase